MSRRPRQFLLVERRHRRNVKVDHVVLVRVFTSTTMRPFETSSVVFTVRRVLRAPASESAIDIGAAQAAVERPRFAGASTCCSRICGVFWGLPSQNSSRTTALIAGLPGMSPRLIWQSPLRIECRMMGNNRHAILMQMGRFVLRAPTPAEHIHERSSRPSLWLQEKFKRGISIRPPFIGKGVGRIRVSSYQARCGCD